MATWTFFAIGCGGAAAFELMRLYELMATLPTRRLRAIVSSRLNITITLGLVIASGFISWAVNAGGDPTVWQLVVTGIGARTLVVKPIELRSKSSDAKLGGRQDGNLIVVADLFP